MFIAFIVLALVANLYADPIPSRDDVLQLSNVNHEIEALEAKEIRTSGDDTKLEQLKQEKQQLKSNIQEKLIQNVQVSTTWSPIEIGISNNGAAVDYKSLQNSIKNLCENKNGSTQTDANIVKMCKIYNSLNRKQPKRDVSQNDN